MISTAIYSILHGNAPVLAVVSNRIFPNMATQGADHPYIVYSVVSKTPTDSKTNGTGFDRYRVQVDCVSDSYTDVEDLAVKVRTALDRVTGIYGGTTITQITYENTVDVHDEFSEDSQQIFQKAVDFMIITK
jgi:hypothetical protein